MTATAVQPSVDHLNVARQMKAYCRRHPWNGLAVSMPGCRQLRQVRAVTDPEMRTNLLLTLDFGPHASGWWRNADYDTCWHLSLSWPTPGATSPSYEHLPASEVSYWARLFFGEWTKWLWHEPGGTRGTGGDWIERARRREIQHLRLFVDLETLQPILPEGEVYDLRRWVDGVTPEKVDR